MEPKSKLITEEIIYQEFTATKSISLKTVKGICSQFLKRDPNSEAYNALQKNITRVLELFKSDMTEEGRKNVIEMFQTLFDMKNFRELLNNRHTLLEVFFKAVMSMEVQDGLALLIDLQRHFQYGLQIFSERTLRVILNGFYRQISITIQTLEDEIHIFSPEGRFFNKSERESPLILKDSIVLHEEMVNNMDRVWKLNFFKGKEIKSIMELYLNFLVNLKVKELQENLAPQYASQIFNLAMKILDFYLPVISEPFYFNSSFNDFLYHMNLIVELKPSYVGSITQFIISYSSILSADMNSSQFSLFRMLFYISNRFPEAILSNIEEILRHEFFLNRSKIVYEEENIFKITVQWIKTSMKLVSSRKILREKLTIERILLFAENQANLLFQERLPFGYFMSIIQNIEALREALRKKIQKERPADPSELSYYSEKVRFLMKKLALFLKQCSHMISTACQYDEFEKLPLHDLLQKEPANFEYCLQEKGQAILNEELEPKNEFQTEYQSFLESFLATQQDSKYILECLVLKAVNLINDILAYFNTEYFRLSVLAKKDQICKKNSSDFDITRLKSISPSLNNFLKRVFSCNIQIFKNLCLKKSAVEIELHKKLKLFMIDFLSIQNCIGKDATSEDLCLSFRDIFKFYGEMSGSIIETFLEIQNSVPELSDSLFDLLTDIFVGKEPGSKEDKIPVSMYVLFFQCTHAFNETLLTTCIKFLQNIKEEKISVLWTENVRNEHILKIIRAIYERIQENQIESTRKSFNNLEHDFLNLSDITFRLILVIMEKTYTDPNILDYLKTLKLIFCTGNCFNEFKAFFTSQLKKYKIYLIGFLLGLYKTNYYDLRILSVELLFMAPIFLEKVIQNEIGNDHNLRMVLDMIEDAFGFNDEKIVQKAMKIFEFVLYDVERSQLEVIFNSKIESIYSSLKYILQNEGGQFQILKKDFHFSEETTKMCTRLIGTFSDFLGNVRDIGRFETKKKQLEKFSLTINDGKFSALDLQEYIELLYQELRDLKERPWISSFSFVSQNSLLIFKAKQGEGLEKLFFFLLKLLEQLERTMREKQSPEQIRFFEKTFECLFHTLVLFQPFDNSKEIPMERELGLFKSFIENNQNYLSIYVKLIVRNSMLNLKIDERSPDLGSFKFVYEFLSNIHFTRDLTKILIEEIIRLLTSCNIYSVNAALLFFNEIIMNPQYRSFDSVEITFDNRMNLIQALITAGNSIDKRFNLRINKKFVKCYESFVNLTLGQSTLSIDPELNDFFQKSENFEDLWIFEATVEISQNKAKNYPKFFKGFKKLLIQRLQAFMKHFKESDLDMTAQWNFEFLYSVRCLLSQSLYAFERKKLKSTIEKMDDKAKVILQFIRHILDGMSLFDQKERENFSKTLIERRNDAGKITSFHNNSVTYFFDADFKISVEKYDLIIKELCVIFERCSVIISSFFSQNAFENQNIRVNDAKFLKLKASYIETKKATLNALPEFFVRCEKPILQQIVKIMPIIQSIEEDGKEDQISEKMRSIIMIMKRNTIGEHNIRIISKIFRGSSKNISLPILYKPIFENLQSQMTDFLNFNSDPFRASQSERELYSLARSYLKLICSSTEKNLDEDSQQMISSLIEFFFDFEVSLIERSSKLSISNKLTNFLEKVKDFLILQFIQNIIQKEDDTKFSIVYDMIKSEKARNIRKALCRDNLVMKNSMIKNKKEGQSTKFLKWSLIMKQLCIHCPGYLKDSKKFASFLLPSNKALQIDNWQTAQSYKKIKTKIQSLFICKFNKSEEILKIYIKDFLIDKCYSFDHRFRPYIESSANSENIKIFLPLTKKITEESVLINRSTENKYCAQFILSKIFYLVAKKVTEDSSDFLFSFLKNENLFFSNNIVAFHKTLIVLSVESKLNLGAQVSFAKSTSAILWDLLIRTQEEDSEVANYTKVAATLFNSRISVHEQMYEIQRIKNLIKFLFSKKLFLFRKVESKRLFTLCLKHAIEALFLIDLSWLNFIENRFEKALKNSSKSFLEYYWSGLILIGGNFYKKFDKILTRHFLKQDYNENCYEILLILIIFASRYEFQDVKNMDCFSPANCTNILERIQRSFKMDLMNDYKYFNILLILLKFWDFYEIKYFHPLLSHEFLDIIQAQTLYPKNKLKVSICHQFSKLALLEHFIRHDSFQVNKNFLKILKRCLFLNMFLIKDKVYIHSLNFFPLLYKLLDFYFLHKKYDESLYTIFMYYFSENSGGGKFFGLVAFEALFKMGEGFNFDVPKTNYLLEFYLDRIEAIENKCIYPKSHFFSSFDVSPWGVPIQQDFIIYLKLFVLILLRFPLMAYEKSRNKEFLENFAHNVKRIFRNLTVKDLDLKFQVLTLLECLVAPELVQDKRLERFSKLDLCFADKQLLIRICFVKNSFSHQETTHKQFQVFFEKYYKILLSFIHQHQMAPEISDIWKDLITHNFICFDRELKKRVVQELNRIVGSNLFTRLRFFFKDQKEDPKKESFETFSFIVAHHLRNVEYMDTDLQIGLHMNGENYHCSTDLLTGFISFQEFEGPSGYFSVKFVKEILSHQFFQLNEGEKENFIFFFLIFIIKNKEMPPEEFQIYMEILFSLKPEYSHSDILTNLGFKNGRQLKFLNYYEELDHKNRNSDSQSNNDDPGRGPPFPDYNDRYYLQMCELTRRKRFHC